MFVDLVNDHGQPCASIVSDTLRKTITSKHVLTRPPAIAFDASHIEAAVAAGVTKVLVRNKETERVYQVSFETFRAKAIRLDRGAGPQWALPLRYWHVDGDQLNVAESPAGERPPASREAVQLALL